MTERQARATQNYVDYILIQFLNYFTVKMGMGGAAVRLLFCNGSFYIVLCL